VPVSAIFLTRIGCPRIPFSMDRRASRASIGGPNASDTACEWPVHLHLAPKNRGSSKPLRYPLLPGRKVLLLFLSFRLTWRNSSAPAATPELLGHEQHQPAPASPRCASGLVFEQRATTSIDCTKHHHHPRRRSIGSVPRSQYRQMAPTAQRIPPRPRRDHVSSPMSP